VFKVQTDGETETTEVPAAINARDPGDTMRLTVLRDGKTIELEATLMERTSRQ
jgi:S1-C subfamily serine protease